MSQRLLLRLGVLSLVALTAAAIPIVISDSIEGSVGSTSAVFKMNTKVDGNIVKAQTGWNIGTASGDGTVFTTTVESALGSMSLTNPFLSGDTINSIILDFSGSGVNGGAPTFTSNPTYNPDFSASGFNLFATVTIGSFSTTVNPLAPVDLSAAMSQILAGNNFQIDWFLQTLFSGDLSTYSNEFSAGIRNWTVSLGEGTYLGVATITAAVDAGAGPGDGAVIPEPSTMVLLGGALVGLAWFRRRKTA